MATGVNAGVLLIGVGRETESAVRSAAAEGGYAVQVESGLSRALGAISQNRFALTVLSVDLEGVDVELIRRVAEQRNAGVLVVVGSAPASELVLAAPGLGVAEVLAEPLQVADAAGILDRLTATGRKLAIPDSPSESDLIGRSPALLAVLATAGQVARSGATVLVLGESGTGKELIARAIHRSSGRAERPFVAVNCAAIPEDLLESELFGHERGAFTGALARKIGRFERANGGTLFLDEIGDMSLVLQAKILRAIQEREIERLGGDAPIAVDVRLIAATHRDLPELVERGDFREDLYYRLAVVVLRVPPLRERDADVRELALQFAAEFTRAHARPVRNLSIAALERLEAHSWPGNVRELRNVLERAVLTCRSDTLTPGDLAIETPRRGVASGEALPGYRADLPLTEVEALHIRRVLETAGGHVGRAAEILGVHRNTVARKATEYGLERRP